MLSNQYKKFPLRFKCKALWLFVLFFIPFFLNAQSHKIDSLQKVLKTAKEDTNEVNILNSLAREMTKTGSYDSSMKYAQDANTLSEKIDYKKGIAKSCQNIGLVFYYQGDYPKALKNSLQGLEMYEKANDKKGIADSYRSIGTIYLMMGKYAESLKNYLFALEIYKALQDKDGIVASYTNLGIIYYSQGNFPEALKYFFLSVNINKETGNTRVLAMTYINMGNAYLKQEKYDEALKYYFLSLEIKKDGVDKSDRAGLYNNIGMLLMNQKKFDSARKYLMEGLQLQKEIKYKEGLLECYSNLAELAGLVGDYKNAFEYHKLYSDIKDSLLNESSSKQIAEMQTKYETEKKDKEIKIQEAEVKKQKIIKFGAFSLAALILLMALIGINNIRIKNKAAQLAKANEVRQRISRDLHDEIGSGLTTISMICKQAKRDSDITVPELSDAVNVQAQSVNQKLRELVWAANPENDNLQVMLSSMRTYVFKYFDNSLTEYSLNVPDEVPNLNLKADVSRNLIFVLKEALNNSTKHSHATNVDVVFNIYENRKFTFKISDNGRGIDYNSMPVQHSGLNNMRSRIEDIKGKFEIITAAGKGTTIEITGTFA